MAAIGSPPRNIDPQLQRYLERMRQAVEVGEGQRPKQSAFDRYVKFKDLVEVGVLRLRGGSGGLGGGNSLWMPNPDFGSGGGPPNMSIPPEPTGLVADAGFKTVILSWDDPDDVYGNHGMTEVLRSTIDDAGTATVVGQSETFMWADVTVEHGLAYFYWIRFISDTDVKGGLNAVNGTRAEPAKITETDIQDDSITTPLLRVGAITADKAVIADGAIFEAMIANAQIGTAKIRDAAITSAKIRFAAITSAAIAEAAIKSAHISWAAIKTAHIGTAEVDTLRIKGHAVTVPITATRPGSYSYPKGGSNYRIIAVSVPNYGARSQVTVSLWVYKPSSGSLVLDFSIRRNGYVLGRAWKATAVQAINSMTHVVLDTGTVGGVYELRLDSVAGSSGSAVLNDTVITVTTFRR